METKRADESVTIQELSDFSFQDHGIVIFRPKSQIDDFLAHFCRGEAALRLTAEGRYLGKVCPSSFATLSVTFFEEFSLFVWVPAIKSENRIS